MINWKNKSQILGKLNKTQNISLCLKTKHLKMSFVKGQPWLSAHNLLTISVTLKLECGNIFDHQGLGTNTDKDDGKSNTQKRSLGIWYVILDIILASCTVCGLLINCKNRRGRVFFEVLDLSASFFFSFFHAHAQILKVSERCQVHEVLFKPRACKVQYFGNKQ